MWAGQLLRGSARRGGGELGQGACPRGEALAGQHGQAERERLSPAVQGSVTQVLVPGIRPGTGGVGVGLGGIRAGARLTGRGVR